MKKLVVLVLVSSLAFLVMWVVFGGVPKRIDTGFATSATVKNYYSGEHIEARVTDAKDIRALKGLLSGFAYNNDTLDHPACMFGTNVSVTLTNGRKSITFCPAFDGDSLVEINETGKYLHISDKRRKALDSICKKYGVDFSTL